MNFCAIDFETATGKRSSACAVGIVTVENNEIVDQYHALIQPPNNEYFWRNIQVHRITSEDTLTAPRFPGIYPEIKKRLQGRKIVAHNESFDRSVLKNTMEMYGLDYGELQLPDRWDCTMKLYKSMGYKPASLDACCRIKGIPLNHHEALSDAVGCAKLFLAAVD
ncbi:MAG: 3'-5' exonuclease [Desulfobacterales bacterium]|nr:3'-5' exonuclease [Desulfobacterales bacterium]